MTTWLKRARHPERLVFVPVLIALGTVWALTLFFTHAQRDIDLKRVTAQLATTVATLADFEQLAGQMSGGGTVTGNARRTAAIWRALLQYPAASIWVETPQGMSGNPPATGGEAMIRVHSARPGLTVHAAMPRAAALADWYQALWRRCVMLLATTAAFLLLTRFLMRALKQRSLAEQMALGQAQRAKTRLEGELEERRVAERALQAHEALLRAVTRGAERLLGSSRHEDAVDNVLELLGDTVNASRVHLSVLVQHPDGHWWSTLQHEWCASAVAPRVESLQRHVDLTERLPGVVAALRGGEWVATRRDELAEAGRTWFAEMNICFLLQVPIRLEGHLWGSLDIIGSAPEPHPWTAAEIDTLQTLAGLVGAAMTRDRQVEQLALANTIILNSPTVLYRLKGGANLTLAYVSPNIGKFGHDAAELVGDPGWMRRLVEPADQVRIRASIHDALAKGVAADSIEFRLRTGSGTWRWVESRYTALRDAAGQFIELEGTLIDVTERRHAQDKIAQLARTDSLTGLANRATFMERIRQAFAATRRGANPFALMYIDLDHFKRVNDTFGHPVGDKLLQEVAQRLAGCVRDTDLVARLGGDEFAVLQTEIREPADAGALAVAIQSSLARGYRIDGNDLQVTASIGISPYAPESDGCEVLLARADLALYRSKEDGRNRYRFHTDDLDTQVAERVALADELRRALEQGQLELRYAPRFNRATRAVETMAAEIHWHHATRGVLGPARFIAAAESAGVVVPLGRWLLDQACAQMREWRDAHIGIPCVSVSLSLAQLKRGRELIADVVAALDRWQLASSDLMFGVTEEMLAFVGLTQGDVLAELSRLGTPITIDDCGGPCSSIDQIRTYRIRHLRIATALQDNADRDPVSRAAVRTIIGAARELGIRVLTDAAGGGVATARSGIYLAGPSQGDAPRALSAAEVSRLLQGGDPDSTEMLG